MRLPRDVDVRSLAAILFAFVVVLTFSGIALVGLMCRLRGVFGQSATCFADNPAALDAVRSLIENILAILLALMAGSRPSGPPPSE